MKKLILFSALCLLWACGNDPLQPEYPVLSNSSQPINQACFPGGTIQSEIHLNAVRFNDSVDLSTMEIEPAPAALGEVFYEYEVFYSDPYYGDWVETVMPGETLYPMQYEVILIRVAVASDGSRHPSNECTIYNHAFGPGRLDGSYYYPVEYGPLHSGFSIGKSFDTRGQFYVWGLLQSPWNLYRGPSGAILLKLAVPTEVTVYVNSTVREAGLRVSYTPDLRAEYEEWTWRNITDHIMEYERDWDWNFVFDEIYEKSSPLELGVLEPGTYALNVYGIYRGNAGGDKTGLIYLRADGIPER